MASVTGSHLTFLSGDGTGVHLVLNPPGGGPAAGAFNIEVFTQGTTPPTPDSGFQASILVQDAVQLFGPNSADVQAGTPTSIETLGTGDYFVIDRGVPNGSGGFAPGLETITLGTADLTHSANQTVLGSQGDTIIGGAAYTGAFQFDGTGHFIGQLIDLSGTDPRTIAGPMEADGGAGSLEIIAGAGDVIRGTVGPTSQTYIIGNQNDVIFGLAGATTIFGGTKAGDGSPLPGASGDKIFQTGGTMLVDGGIGASITGGGTGALLVVNQTGLTTVVAGGGDFYFANNGAKNQVTGSTGTGTTWIDDTFGGGGGSTLVGGSGTGTLPPPFFNGENTFIKGAATDTISVGGALTFVDASAGKIAVFGGNGIATGPIENYGAGNPGETPVNTVVRAGAGDTITGGGPGNTMYVDAGSAASVVGASIAGGASDMTVFGGTGDTITGGSGSLLVHEGGVGTSGGETIIGGGASTSNLSVFNFGKGDSIVGGAGINFIQDLTGAGGSTILGGTGTGTSVFGGSPATNTFIIGNLGDTIVGQSGSMYVNGNKGGEVINAGSGSTTVTGGNGNVISNTGIGTLLVDINPTLAGAETVSLAGSHGTTTLRDVSVTGGVGTATTAVVGFSTVVGSQDIVASKQSVTSGGAFLGTALASPAGTTLIFLDGSKMFLAGVSDPTTIKFTQ